MLDGVAYVLWQSTVIFMLYLLFDKFYKPPQKRLVRSIGEFATLAAWAGPFPRLGKLASLIDLALGEILVGASHGYER